MSVHGCLAQLVERRPYKANVGGSNPSLPTSYAGVAQLVEHLPSKQNVVSSNLIARSKDTQHAQFT